MVTFGHHFENGGQKTAKKGLKKMSEISLFEGGATNNNFFGNDIDVDLKIILCCKLVLLDKYLLKCCDIVLLVEHQHRLFVIYRINCAE